MGQCRAPWSPMDQLRGRIVTHNATVGAVRNIFGLARLGLISIWSSIVRRLQWTKLDERAMMAHVLYGWAKPTLAREDQ